MDWLLIVSVALLIGTCVGIFFYARRQEPIVFTDAERIAWQLNHIAQVLQYERPGPISDNTEKQLRRTLVDIQGAIEVFARWAVHTFPELLEDMEPPDHWASSLPQTGPIFTSDVESCARCGGTHKGLEFRPLANPLQAPGATTTMTHWVPCPINGEPILMRIVGLGSDEQAGGPSELDVPTARSKDEAV